MGCCTSTAAIENMRGSPNEPPRQASPAFDSIVPVRMADRRISGGGLAGGNSAKVNSVLGSSAGMKLITSATIPTSNTRPNAVNSFFMVLPQS